MALPLRPSLGKGTFLIAGLPVCGTFQQTELEASFIKKAYFTLEGTWAAVWREML